MFTPGSDSPVDELNPGSSVSLDRAAELLKVSRRTIYNRIKSGRLQTIRRYQSQRVLVESLLSFRFHPEMLSRTPSATFINDRRARS